MTCLRRITLFALAALLLAPVAIQRAYANGTSDSTDIVEAIWRIQRVEFMYNSRDVYYSCDALQYKIGAILKAVGAHHQGVRVELRCIGRFVNHASGRVTVVVPAEATEDNVIAATTFDAQAQLVARMRKVTLPTPADIERFPASWRSVSLNRQRGLKLESGDCDLLQALRRQVFPTVPIRVESEALHCGLGAGTGMRPKLDVTALMPVATTDFLSMRR